MGETGKDALRVGFNRTINLAFHGVQVSSDAGLFPYRDLDDAACLTDSAGMKLGDAMPTGRRPRPAQVLRFETDVLVHPDNLAAMMNMPGQWVDLISQRGTMQKLTLDMDSSVSEAYGQQ